MELWVDDNGYIRRIRHTTGGRDAGKRTTTADLREFGIELPVDWSRLPTSRPTHPPLSGLGSVGR